MGVLGWMAIALLAIALTIVAFLYPSLWVLGLIALGVMLLYAIVLLVRRGSNITDEEYDERTRSR